MELVFITNISTFVFGIGEAEEDGEGETAGDRDEEHFDDEWHTAACLVETVSWEGLGFATSSGS